MVEVGLIFWLGLAVAAGVIASSKGRSGLGYFVLGFFLPIVGAVIALGVTDRRGKPEPLPAGTKICLGCNRRRLTKLPQCPHCGLKPDEEAHIGQKKCPACAEWILKEAKKCKHCGEMLSAHPTSEREQGRREVWRANVVRSMKTEGRRIFFLSDDRVAVEGFEGTFPDVSAALAATNRQPNA